MHVANAPLTSNGTYTASGTFRLPEGISGKKYIHVITDRDLNYECKWQVIDNVPAGEFPEWPSEFRTRVWEADQKLNNGRGSEMAVTFREPNLTLNAPPIVAATADSGGMLSLSWDVINAGDRATRVDTWYDRIYISTDPSLDIYDQLLGTSRHTGILAPNQTYHVDTEVRLPDNIDGDFYILIYVDSPFGQAVSGALPYPAAIGGPRITLDGDPMGYVHEFQNEDNDITAKPISVSRVNSPDLRVSDIVIPERATIGRGVTIQYEVINDGPGIVPDRQNQWIDSIYFSRDAYLDVRSDSFAGSVFHSGALAVGGTHSVTQTVAIPRGIRDGYYVFVVTDVAGSSQSRGTVYEGGGELNNATLSDAPLIIELPPPADLVIQSASLPTTAFSGDQVTVTWTGKNASSEPISAIWDDAVYLSSDATWDLADKLIGRFAQGSLQNGPKNLAPNAEYSGSLTMALPTVLPGSYRAIVRTDIFDDINEGSLNANNHFASPGSINVQVHTLAIDVPTGDTLSTGDEVLYRVAVPAGETLEFTLTSESDQAAHEVYVRYEGLPSLARL